VYKPFEKTLKKARKQVIGNVLKNIWNNETYISTLSKKKKEQARFQKPHGH